MNNFKYLLLVIISSSWALEDEKKNWWRYTNIYEVYIRSFKDSDGDGIGDIKGITMMLDHFVDLNIETLWLSPYCVSPMKDNGYDVADYMDIDPTFGTMNDFEELARESKKRGLKLLMDLVINHSSDEHEWFKKSVNKIAPYDNYYIWKDAKGRDSNGKPIPPSNWVSRFGGSSWKWNEKRQQFYLHQFAVFQPDLNLRDKNFKSDIKKVLKFWIERGISAFRLDATTHYMEDVLLRDEPLAKKRIADPYYDLTHIYTTDLPESYEFINELREYVDSNFNRGHDFEKFIVVEAYTDLNHTMQYYGRKDFPVVHFPFNFVFVDLTEFPNAHHLDRLIKYWLDNMPSGGVANWVAENHDNYRVGSRLNEEFMDIMTTLVMMLPGVACIYYGEEIGMMDNALRPDQLRDALNGRDPERLPMQWDDSLNAGFSTKHKPWLPLHTNYWKVNVDTQKKHKTSRYHMFKKLSELRKTKTGKRGLFKSHIMAPWVYAFTRSYPGEPTYIMIFNVGTELELVDIHVNIFGLPKQLTVVTSSLNSGFTSGSKIKTRSIMPLMLSMRPMSSVVLTTKSSS